MLGQGFWGWLRLKLPHDKRAVVQQINQQNILVDIQQLSSKALTTQPVCGLTDERFITVVYSVHPRITSYYNLSSVTDSVCPLTLRPFMDLRAPNLAGRSSYYKMTISLFARESGWEPHWQGASWYNSSRFSPIRKHPFVLTVF